MDLEKYEKAQTLQDQIKRAKEKLSEWNDVNIDFLSDIISHPTPGTSNINLWNKRSTATRIEMDSSHFLAIRDMHVKKYTATLKILEKEFENL